MKLLQKESNATTGYLIMSALFVVLFALAFRDATYVVFGIPILLVFTLASSIGKGNSDQDLEAIGWSSKNMDVAVPLGIAGGIVSLFLGSIITTFTAQNVGSIVPDFSSSASIAGASVIAPSIALAANIISQWLVVAPSEEAGYRILAPYAGVAVFKNIGFAWIFASGLWILTHVPAFLAQGVSNSMYLVLGVISVITIGLLWFTGNIMSTIITHGTFNTGVLLLSQEINIIGYYVVAIIAIILSIAYYSGKKRHA